MRELPTMVSHRLDLPSICDICGKARSTRKHAACSRARQQLKNEDWATYMANIEAKKAQGRLPCTCKAAPPKQVWLLVTHPDGHNWVVRTGSKEHDRAIHAHHLHIAALLPETVPGAITQASLSASAEPATCGACAGCTDGCRVDRESPPVERDERAEFEAHMRRDFPGVYLTRSLDRESYRNPSHQGAWLSWQARAALERKP